MKYSAGDVVLAYVSFVDSSKIKMRPAVVLFEELGNYVIAGITSNPYMEGIKLPNQLAKPSIIKTNYIFTVDKHAICKKLTSLDTPLRTEIYNKMVSHSKQLIAM